MDPIKQTTLPSLIFFLLLSMSAGQSNQPDPRTDPYNYGGRLSAPMAIVVVVVIAALFFMGFFTMYIRHCSGALDGSVTTRTGVARRRIANATVARGLDAETIETFPTFIYSEVKTQKIGKGALECAICLNEFEDDETLRLLPKCDHVFHPHCIAAWLQGHVTCPVCRTNLAEETEMVEPNVGTEIDLEAQEQSVITEPVVELPRVKFSRSHTTGHSVILPGESIDRFTLRLPDDLRKKIMANWKLNRSNSLLVLPRGGSSRNGKPVDRSRGSGSVRGNSVTSPTGDSVRGDRWAFLRNPSFLWRNKDGEGTSSVQHTGTTGSVKLPV